MAEQRDVDGLAAHPSSTDRHSISEVAADQREEIGPSTVHLDGRSGLRHWLRTHAVEVQGLTNITLAAMAVLSAIVSIVTLLLGHK